MKKLLRVLVPAVFVMAFCNFSGGSIFAQATIEECESIYKGLLDNRTSPEIEKLRGALSSANEYLKRCKDLPDQEKVKTYVTNQVPKLEERIKVREIEILEARFNAALKAKNADDTIARAKELIALERPYSLDLMLDIASVGFDSASANPPVDKYNTDGIANARMVLQKMTEGKSSGNSDKYGFYAEYKTEKCPDGRTNAIGWMNYTIGFITYVRLKQPKEAIPYLYKATQAGCETKGFAEPYRLIGAWYLDGVVKQNASYAEKTKALGDTNSDETLAILAMAKGYADRAIDAYARAYQMAMASKTASQPYKDALLKKIKDVFEFRYDGDLSKVDNYLANVGSTPFIDPATPVSAVK